MAGESLKKKFQDFLVEQVFGKGAKYVVPDECATQKNEDKIRGNTFFVSLKVSIRTISGEAEIVTKDSCAGLTEEEAEDGTWILYRKSTPGNGDVKNGKNEAADEHSTDEAATRCEGERSYYRSLNLTPGKVPH
ncbi:hypothetical protein Y032_0122g1064 [Ancylostoma ceylanicum]|uniref:Uncharacterized protein n=1 Tax=Ancylostoma ceylanicum TaxID=53326 RepID=A0A016T9X7_9BILA|nr:hypothetical protein Y032_0122g1064 [Ancylostoma ceylanicum]